MLDLKRDLALLKADLEEYQRTLGENEQEDIAARDYQVTSDIQEKNEQISQLLKELEVFISFCLIFTGVLAYLSLTGINLCNWHRQRKQRLQSLKLRFRIFVGNLLKPHSRWKKPVLNLLISRMLSMKVKVS